MTTIQSSPQMHKLSLTDHFRLVWALAGKDIVDALKTRSTLATIIISVLMVVFYRYFPVLTEGGDTLNVLVYPESESAVTKALESSPELAVYTYDSREQLMSIFAGTESVELAIELPQTAVSQQQTGEPITIDGRVMYWVSESERAKIKAMVETDLSDQLGRPVTLKLEGNDVYFSADEFFFAFSSTIALLFIAVMIGISLIPNLMVEEKQTRTLDALLVSPASAVHVVAGKAIAGLFYGLVGSAVVLVVFRYLIIQWSLAVLAAVLGTLFMVAIGLLLGSYVNVRSQLQLIAGFAAMPLLLPVIVVALEGLVPTGVIAVINWIPTVLVAKLFRLSLTPNATFTHYGAGLGVIIASTLALFALAVWVVNRQDRR
ncbi:MAG: ABC transporter permease [Candidatus Promineifilaceae bacterium]